MGDRGGVRMGEGEVWVGDREGVRVGELGGLERRGGMGGQQREVE